MGAAVNRREAGFKRCDRGLPQGRSSHTIRSATAACLTLSNCLSSCGRVDRVDHRHHTVEHNRVTRNPSDIMVCRMGAGSARPVVSITMRSNWDPTRPALEQRLQRIQQIVPHGAAQTPRTQQNRVLVHLFDKRIVQPILRTRSRSP